VTAYKRYSELYGGWLLAGLLAVIVEVGLSVTVSRRNP
jgi:hypothetical protein